MSEDKEEFNKKLIEEIIKASNEIYKNTKEKDSYVTYKGMCSAEYPSASKNAFNHPKRKMLYTLDSLISGETEIVFECEDCGRVLSLKK